MLTFDFFHNNYFLVNFKIKFFYKKDFSMKKLKDKLILISMANIIRSNVYLSLEIRIIIF